MRKIGGGRGGRGEDQSFPPSFPPFPSLPLLGDPSPSKEGEEARIGSSLGEVKGGTARREGMERKKIRWTWVGGAWEPKGCVCYLATEGKEELLCSAKVNL